ncbi:unnamed protein product [Zymoseptoria tritici ST99CH_1A5]|uniref:PHD finger protein n=1 Tax=Zymoseptoria tritici ST99CH_1A5 TaxID=1276529 RepID=A0A1Y6LMG5_ZYMTR|nr:unnamed protein product [Zymoseptoria tritici ST99CH_1A5]
MSPPVASTGFQAINHRPATENARIEGSAANQQRGSMTPPIAGGSVTHPAPQTAQTSAPATQPVAKTSMESGDASDAAMDATYGTRSRNRTNNRPNYAEDQEMDFEMSSTGASRKKVAADASANGTPDSRNETATSSSATAASIHAASSNSKVPASGGAKDPTPATSSRKRKAAGAPASNLNTPVSSTPPPSGARKTASTIVPPPSSSSSHTMARETNIMTFSKCRSSLNKKDELVSDDGQKLSVNDHVYLVCEPPGDPYYLCRIMEFLHVDTDNPNSPVDAIRVNWYYRPRDVQRFSSDTRLVFGTMHSDICPLTSLRGKCTIKHRSEIEDIEAYRKEPDSFFFVQVFDRFIRRSYECIPVEQIINVPEKVKKALDERWKFVVVEIGRVKELTSAAKTCKRCARYCASSDSVDCAICKNAYHMNCVQPPLPKKPSRGFAWACGPCSRASEQKLEAHSTPAGTDVEEEGEEVVEEEVPAASNDTTRAPSPSGSDMVVDDHPATQAEIALAKMWPMRYLGVHARVEDALQYDDRAIYPRASSRLGPRHQANTNMWHGRPVELVKPAEIKKRYNKTSAQKTQGKLTKETVAAIEADREEKSKRPKWVQDEPPGYVARGEDYDAKDPRCTAKLMFKMPSIDEAVEKEPAKLQEATDRNDKFVDDYINRAKGLARQVGVPPFGTNFLDKAFELLVRNKYNQDAALKQLQKVDRVKDLHEPVLSKADLQKFEEGVAKYGSEHRLIRLHMKTDLPNADIVRFYYLWKKTPKGREIWGNYGGRKKRKMDNDAGARLQAEVANDADDSAFDKEKAARKNRGFQCKFCSNTHSRQWRRAPGVSPGQTAPADTKGSNKDSKKDRPLLALCLRCCGLWRKYAIQWEELDEASKRAALGGGRGLKRKLDNELIQAIITDSAEKANPPPPPPETLPSIGDGEPPKKKAKNQEVQPVEPPKKKEKPPPPPKEPTPPPPPIIPAQPTWKELPCAICRGFNDTVACSHCKLTVHRRCFGLAENEGIRPDGGFKWVCEQCQNDRNPAVSTDYSCCLCLTEETLVDLVEPPRVSHKKKTDREREKERLEKELADNMRIEYRNKQLNLNRSPIPREPLKRTTGNNWVHVYCAVWAPEIRFSDAKALEVAEGFPLIPQARFEAVCKLCKNKDHQNRTRDNAGACISCLQCSAYFHASCAFEAGYTFGFDVTPVKGSRKDQVITATLGQETGAVTAVVLCKEHVTKTELHPINEIEDEQGTTALQIFVEKYKQADLTLTGTVRKANMAQLTKDKSQLSVLAAQNSTRRESGAQSIAAAVKRGSRNSTVGDTKTEAEDEASSIGDVLAPERRCVKCDIDVTPKWHLVPKDTPPRESAQAISSILNGTSDPDKPTDRPAQNTSAELARPADVSNPPIGVPGRPWELARPAINGEHQPSDGSPGMLNSQAHQSAANGPTSNGDARPPQGDVAMTGVDDEYHTHALPRFQNPAGPPVLEHEQIAEEGPQDYLCHKCFLKKKLNPTPPPEDGASRMPLSSPSGTQTEANKAHKVEPRSIEEQFRVWDVPPPRPPPAPSPLPGQMNGMSHPLFGGPPGPPNYPPAPHYGPSAYQSHPPHGPPPPMHERHNSNNYGFQQQPPPHQGSYPPQGSPNMPAYPTTQQRHAHMNGYPPNGPPMSNGMPSSHNSQPPPMHSPGGYSQHPPHPHHQPSPYSDFQLHRPPPPPMHGSMYGRSESMDGPPPLPRQHQHQPQQQQQQAPQPPPPAQQQHAPPPPNPMIDPQLMGPDPVPGPAWPQEHPQPTTPRGGQPPPATAPPNGTNVSGASASPNLMNLIH